MKKLLLFSISLVCFSAAIHAQPRPADKTAAPSAPDSYLARYESGIFGSNAKEKGTLKFDDENLRVVFYRKDGREMFAIPYESLVMIYPDSKESVPQKGKVLSSLPLPGAGLFGLMSKSTKYAILSFDDPEVEARGTANFRFDNKQDLINFIGKLGNKAKMVQRGDAFYRPKKTAVF